MMKKIVSWVIVLVFFLTGLIIIANSAYSTVVLPIDNSINDISEVLPHEYLIDSANFLSALSIGIIFALIGAAGIIVNLCFYLKSIYLNEK